MPRSLVWTLYGCLVLIWSSTWVAIKIGLEDLPPLLGAGIRFGLAGAGLLAVARLLGRPLRTDGRLATVLALFPFAGAYGLIYWGEQYVPSGLAAVLFGIMPLYSAVRLPPAHEERDVRRCGSRNAVRMAPADEERDDARCWWRPGVAVAGDTLASPPSRS